jgi:RHS repeat-associated protein
VNPTYDARGNLTSAGSTTYGYTSENRLASAGANLFAYDPLGRMHYYAQGGVAFMYDGSEILAELNLSNPSQILRRYVSGAGQDEPLVWYEGAGTTDRRFLHHDERGSVVAVTNSAGAVIAINGYDEHGIPNSTNQGRFQYTGQAWLAEARLYYYKARIYSPSLGRFLQADPIGYGDGTNMYAYAHGDPVNGRDPSGLCDVQPCGGIIVTGPWASVFDMIDSHFAPTAADGFDRDLNMDAAARRKKPRPQTQAPVCPTVPANRPVGTRGQWNAALHDPMGAVSANEVRNYAEEQAKNRFPELRGHNDIRDAYRHFMWMYGMGRLLGEARARAFGNAHEANYPNNPPAEQDMDTYNNEVALGMLRDPRYAGMPTADVAEIAMKNHCLKVLK